MHCSVYTYEALGSRRYIQRCHCCTFPKLSSTHRGPLPSKSILLWDIRISSEVRMYSVYTGMYSVYTGMYSVYTGMYSVYTGMYSVYTGMYSVYTGMYSVYTDMYSVRTYVSSVVCTVYLRNRVVCTVYAVVCDYHYWYP